MNVSRIEWGGHKSQKPGSRITLSSPENHQPRILYPARVSFRNKYPSGNQEILKFPQKENEENLSKADQP